MRELDRTIFDSQSIFKADKWQTFKSAMRACAGLNEKGEIKTPTFLSTTGFYFKKLAKILLVKCVALKPDIDGWLAYYDLEHYRQVTKPGICTSKKKQDSRIATCHRYPKG
uniref:Uncharacterized protein n=1 Tax=Cacopsylla melanoneura TaxID=428564 RepID=A0A8D8TAH6_9HEMI